MEHVVQIGINIDDDAIRRSIEHDAKKKIIDDIEDDIRKCIGIPPSPYSSHRYEYDALISKIVEKVYERNKDQIVKSVAELLAQSAPRQKWYRDAMKKAVGGDES